MIRLVLLLALPAAVLLGCRSASQEGDGWPDGPGPKVLTSFAPIRCFALNVAGEHARVKAVMSTQGPHEYKGGRDDARLLTGADLFVINGLGLDNDIAGRMQKLAGTGLTLLKLGDGLPADMLQEGVCTHDHGDHEHHDHGTDAHVWMGLEQAEKMVTQLRDELKATAPAHAAEYDRRAAGYVAKLRKIKADGLAALAGKAETQFVSFHGSMGYFAKTFGLKPPEVIQEIAGTEPTGKQLAALVDRCVKNKIRVVAVEPQYSAATSAKVIVDELKKGGVADPVVIVLDPLETAPEAEFNADWYEAKMRANVVALAKALR